MEVRLPYSSLPYPRILYFAAGSFIVYYVNNNEVLICMGDNNQSTLQKSIGGGKWMFINTALQKIITLGSLFILARLLLPRDFGLIAIMLIVPPILDILTSVDFENALIYRKADPYPYLNGIWTINVVRSFFIFIIVFLTGPAIAKFFHVDGEATLIRMGGLLILFSGLNNVGQFFFFKNIDFKKVFIRDISGQTAYFLVAVTLAIYTRSFWALFLGQAAMYFTSMVVTYFLHDYRPRLTLKFKHFKELLPYVKWTYGQGILSQIMSTIENTVIGRFIGATEVGLYSKANGLASAPISPFLSIINKVGFPVYSEIQEFSYKVKEGFMRSLDVLFFVTVPFLFLVLTSADRLVLITLGKNWVGIGSLFKILTVAATLHIISALAATVFNALGHPKFQFAITVLNFILLIPLLLAFAPRYGVESVANIVLFSSIIVSGAAFYKVAKLTRVTIGEFTRVLAIPILSSSFVTVIGEIMIWSFDLSRGIPFLAVITALGIVYLSLIFLAGKKFRRGPYQTIRLIIDKGFVK